LYIYEVRAQLPRQMNLYFLSTLTLQYTVMNPVAKYGNVLQIYVVRACLLR